MSKKKKGWAGLLAEIFSALTESSHPKDQKQPSRGASKAGTHTVSYEKPTPQPDERPATKKGASGTRTNAPHVHITSRDISNSRNTGTGSSGAKTTVSDTRKAGAKAATHTPAEETVWTPPVQKPQTKQERLLADMRRYENSAGFAAAFVPYGNPIPSYEDMEYRQKAWYFYWRSQVRQGQFPRTDTGYLHLYCYELLSGIGVSGPAEGYRRLLGLWEAYYRDFPLLNQVMTDWLWDFAREHDLEYTQPEWAADFLHSQLAVRNLLLEEHRLDRPLKLSYPLVLALSAYNPSESKFYKDGHGDLLREAIPRALALADAALLKQGKKGILATYGPARPKKQTYVHYKGALCQGSGVKDSYTLRGYAENEKLGAYVTNLTRHTENVLRGILGVRGRLRGVELDEETAALVEAFLKKEYTPKPAEAPEPEKPRLELDFDSIDTLREQSNAVREALEVTEEGETPPVPGNEETPEPPPVKAPATDVDRVLAMLRELPEGCAALLAYLRDRHWECPFDPVLEGTREAINEAAKRHLSQPLLVMEGSYMIVEDDYVDELEHIFAHDLLNPQPAETPERPEIPQRPETPETPGIGASSEPPEPPAPQRKKPESPTGEPVPAGDDGLFDFARLTGALAELLEALSPLQLQVLHAILTLPDPMPALELLAEEAFSMPEMLLDELNDLAMGCLDNILIDNMGDSPQVLEEYLPELKQAVR